MMVYLNTLLKTFNAVGIAYKLAESIAEHYHVKCIEKYLDLVALGIASSDVPLVGENLDMLKKRNELYNR